MYLSLRKMAELTGHLTSNLCATYSSSFIMYGIALGSHHPVIHTDCKAKGIYSETTAYSNVDKYNTIAIIRYQIHSTCSSKLTTCLSGRAVEPVGDDERAGIEQAGGESELRM